MMKKILFTLTLIITAFALKAQPLNAVVDFTIDNFCFGEMNGMAQVTASGGTPPYSFSISPNPGFIQNTVSPTTEEFRMLMANSYDVTVTDGNSDTYTVPFFINEPSPIVVTSNTIPDSCNQCVGSIEIIANGGFAPYQYSFDGGNNYLMGNTKDTICANTHLIQVLDQNGCIVQSNVTVNNVLSGGGSAVGSITSTPAFCNNGSLDITLTGGNAPFDIDWVTGDTLAMINNLAPGNYTATVTDANGCQKQFSGTVADSTNGQCSSISGNIYSDLNNNCTDDSEPSIFGKVVTAQPGNYSAITDQNGNYTLNVPFGTYTIQPGNLSSNVCTGSYNVTTSVPSPFVTGIDFADSVALDIETYLNPGFIRPVMTNYQYLHTINQTALSSAGDIYYVPDANYTVAQTIPAFDSQNGDTLFWTNATINAMSTHIISIEGNTTVPLNTQLYFCHGYTSPIQESDLTNNEYCDTVTVIGSYDPNDKQVTPSGDLLLTDNLLTYKIRFQNTGTDTAFNVFIIDTLSQHLDASSFQFVTASHNCIPELIDNNVLKFNFPNILLADSNTNEPLSHGHVVFRIKQSTNNQIGDVIENTAGIYFDYNEPVITNTTYSPIVQEGASIEEYKSTELFIYPNPTNSNFTVQFGNQSIGQVKIVDLQGREIFTKQLTGEKQIRINTEEWNQGIYMVIWNSENEISTSKVVVTTKYH